MICLDNTDTLEGGASVDAVVDYTVHGLVGMTFTNLAQGQLSDTDPSVLYTAGAAISVVSIVFVNTHNTVVTVNLYLDPANAGTPRRLIPKTLSLAVGYSMHFDGAKLTILDTNGGIVSGLNVSDTAYDAASWNGVTTIAPSKNAVRDEAENKAPKASPTFTGQATIPTINLTGGQIAFPATAVPSAVTNTLDDYEEGVWTIGISFGDGTTGITYSYNTGFYTKIGNLVTCFGYLILSSKGTSVGAAKITGLPFTINISSAAYSAITLCLTNITFANNFQGNGIINTSTIALSEITEAGTFSDLANTNFANSSNIMMSLSYNV